MTNQLPDLKVYLAAPRGFCAGVVRAIDIVERALELHGKPVYVRHEIVHNKYVVEDLKQKGAIFVEELDEVPDGDRPVIFSAHGVPKSVPEAAKNRNMFYLDATCPLVSKVHMEASRHFQDGYEIVLIGHAGHPEVIGTMGQLPDNAITLVEDEADVAAFTPKDAQKLAYITQTTLSVDDTRGIIEALEKEVPQHPRTAQGRHLLCHDQPPGIGQVNCRQVRHGAGGWRTEQFQLATPGRSCPDRRLRPVHAGAARLRDRLDCHARHQDAGHHCRGICAGSAGQRSG